MIAALGERSVASRSREWLGTFWAHSVSTEVNSGESHFMSFCSSAPVRLRDQHLEPGSIPGSSTEGSRKCGSLIQRFGPAEEPLAFNGLRLSAGRLRAIHVTSWRRE